MRPPSGVNLMALRQQVVEHLLHAGLVLVHRRQVRLDVALQVDVLALRQRPGHVALGRHHLADAEVRQPRLHLAALDLGQVEDVVDHLQQRLARLLDVQHVPLLLVVQGVDRAEDLAEAEDAVQRRAQLVAHGGQEVALERVELVEPHVGLGQLVHFAVEVGVGLAQFLLRADQVAQHAVEGRGQLLELVAGVDVGPERGVAAAHGVAHVAQMPQRLDDHVADDGIQGDHRQEDGDDGRGDEDGAVIGDVLAGRPRWRSVNSATAIRSPSASATELPITGPPVETPPVTLPNG